MRKFLIAAALAAAMAVPALASATESATEPERQETQVPSRLQDAEATNVSSGGAREAAPIVEARARQRR